MSTVTSESSVATITQVTGMRKNGESFSASSNRACAFRPQTLYAFDPQRRRVFYHVTDEQSGKQWHETKKAFRPTAGQTSYAKRQAKDQALAVVKAQEKEMKEEKEAERKVRQARRIHFPWTATNTLAETYHSTQGEARGKGGEGALRENGSQDAPEESRQTEAQREEKQAPQVIEEQERSGEEVVKKW